MKKHSYFILFLLCLTCSLHAQLPDGSIAPDFTATDLDGVEHNLYDLLAEGKSVVIDFSATWCGPCWSYHNSGSLHDYMELYGPAGTDETMVLHVECDISTTIEDLYGTGNNTIGDWVTGTNYPIIDAAFVANMFQINYYPTVMLICPDRKVLELGAAAADVVHSNSMACPSIDYAPEVAFWADNYDGCNSLTVQFSDNSWPRPDNYEWSFGDGATSTERNPIHTYTNIGDYDVSLLGTNAHGGVTLDKADYISVGIGSPHSDEKVGPVDNNIGTGRYFEGGHQGLIFDAINDFVLTSVKVFSDLEAERTVSLSDSDGNLISTRTVMIPVGEHRIDLNMFVPQGTNYRLGLHSDAYLYRNDGGAQFPYTVDNLVSITMGTASTAPLQYYYYFYDWEVREPGCDGIVNDEEVFEESTKLYPVPVNGYLNIETKDMTNQPRVFNAIGQELNLTNAQQGNGWRLDMNDLDRGVYFIEVGEEVYTVPKI